MGICRSCLPWLFSRGNLRQLFAVWVCRSYLPLGFAAAVYRGDLLQLFAVEICRSYLPWLFAAAVCRSYLPWEFAVGICRSYLSWVFAVGLFFVCKQTFFLCERIFLLCKQTFFYWKRTFFIWEQNFFLFMRISFLTVFLFVIAVAVMGHRTFEYKSFSNTSISWLNINIFSLNNKILTKEKYFFDWIQIYMVF